MSFKCPQCGSMECGPIRCRFTMKDHKDMSACREDAPSGFTRVLPASVYGRRAVSPNDTVHGQEDALLPTPHAAPPELPAVTSASRAMKAEERDDPRAHADDQHGGGASLPQSLSRDSAQYPAASAPDIGYECAWPR